MAARKMKLAVDHTALAQCYSQWARKQINLAEQSLNPKARNDRFALAEYYFSLAKAELAAVKCLDMPGVPEPPTSGRSRAA